MEKAYRNICFPDTFFGHAISNYGLRCGRVDYACLASTFDAVLCNSVFDVCTKLDDFPELVQGEYRIDTEGNEYSTEEAEEIISRLEEKLDLCQDDEGEVTRLQSEIECLSEPQMEEDVYQYYIISNQGADILRRYTNELLWYSDALECYIWGVTHYGTAWSYVLTCIPCAKL